tara:strand:+ start:784 stop:1188 length:405 start_codon:yes stop_codon:yes gene_type:complete
MSFIKKIEKDYNEDLISLKELDDMRAKYSNLNNSDKLILDQQSVNKDFNKLTDDYQVEDSPKLSIPTKDSLDSSYSIASDGWIIAGFIFAFLGGFLGIAIGSNYAFGNYKKSTKNLGWVMLIMSVFSITILKSI